MAETALEVISRCRATSTSSIVGGVSSCGGAAAVSCVGDGGTTFWLVLVTVASKSFSSTMTVFCIAGSIAR